MIKRVIDFVVSLIALTVGTPLMAAAAIGVLLTNRGPVLYRARRSGLHGETFTMHKFRTMALGGEGSAITSTNDPRVFAFGALLRTLKIDELPQFYDVLRGKMSLVGPRPEDPAIVANFSLTQRETLSVRPGITSPGAIYNYTHGHLYLTADDPEQSYVEKLLPIKVALEVVYVRHVSPIYDLRLLARTILVIVMVTAGRRRFRDPPEMREALLMLDEHGTG